MVFIVIPVHNRIEMTQRCLRSLHEQTIQSYKVIVVDDGSNDGTAEMVAKEFPSVVLLHGDGNLWWTGATNLGVKYALDHALDGDYILTLNNDTEFEVDYVERLVNTAKNNPESLIGSLSVSIADKSTITDGGVRINWCTAKFNRLSHESKIEESGIPDGQVVQVDALSGRGTLVPIELFNRIGLYNEKKLPHYGADYEFSLRAKRLGYHLLMDYSSVVYSHTKTTGITNEYSRLPASELLRSFFSKRSPYQILTRWRFARLAAPRFHKLSFFFFDLGRLILGRVRNQLRQGSLPM